MENDRETPKYTARQRLEREARRTALEADVARLVADVARLELDVARQRLAGFDAVHVTVMTD